MNGHGILTHADGRVEDGVWRNNQYFVFSQEYSRQTL